MEIKMVRCPNGHYYNAALHESCPECSQEVGRTEAVSDSVIGRTEIVGGNTVGKTEVVTPPVPDYGMTVAVDDAEYEEAIARMEKTAQQLVPEADAGPAAPAGLPVGWLVCVSGPDKGRDFRLYSGYNHIGRTAGDIVLPGDDQLAPQSHAIVTYIPEEAKCYIGPSFTRSFVRADGKIVPASVELSSYDEIEIGSTKLCFVALCGSAFSWENENE